MNDREILGCISELAKEEHERYRQAEKGRLSASTSYFVSPR